jgi:hypothetical protein
LQGIQQLAVNRIQLGNVIRHKNLLKTMFVKIYSVDSMKTW